MQNWNAPVFERITGQIGVEVVLEIRNLIHTNFLATMHRGVGTCLRVGWQDQKWGAKTGILGKMFILEEFCWNFSKSGGICLSDPSFEEILLEF